MQQINIYEIFDQKFKDYFASKPEPIRKILVYILKKILYIVKINHIIEKYEHLDTKHFIIQLFDELNFSFLISDKDLQKIPAEGRVICVANHPIGSLDSLVLLKAFLDVRSDVKIVANDIITNLDFMKNYILPINLYKNSFQRNNILSIEKALEEEKAIIIFPAAEVSRLKWYKVKDSKWRNGAVYYAQKYNSPILPVFIDAKNSPLFYFISLFSKRLSMLLLVHELFNKKNKTIRIIIGDVISAKTFSSQNLNINYKTKLLRKHVYQLKKKRANIFKTEKSIIRPIDKKILKYEVDMSDCIGATKDGKKIIITTNSNSPNILSEIARLRELTFRKVGEGTGRMMDMDKFDKLYSHLIIWDEYTLEIVGSYRIGIGEELLVKSGIGGFYTSTLFNFSEAFIENILPYSIELGRSFVQEKYWNTQALDYLWQGIGSFLSKNPKVKYMFGGVSLSSNYSPYVISLIVFYFKKWFSSVQGLSSAKKNYTLTPKQIKEYSKIFSGLNAKEDMKILKKILALHGFSIPVLYKHYSDLCYEGGVCFLDFGIDPDFNNCIDGLILVDISKIREDKKKRYLESEVSNNNLVVDSIYA